MTQLFGKGLGHDGSTFNRGAIFASLKSSLPSAATADWIRISPIKPNATAFAFTWLNGFHIPSPPTR
jgi:hypothetical protein